jgi:hypothetical protein
MNPEEGVAPIGREPTPKVSITVHKRPSVLKEMVPIIKAINSRWLRVNLLTIETVDGKIKEVKLNFD